MTRMHILLKFNYDEKKINRAEIFSVLTDVLNKSKLQEITEDGIIDQVSTCCNDDVIDGACLKCGNTQNLPS